MWFTDDVIVGGTLHLCDWCPPDLRILAHSMAVIQYFEDLANAYFLMLTRSLHEVLVERKHHA